MQVTNTTSTTVNDTSANSGVVYLDALEKRAFQSALDHAIDDTAKSTDNTAANVDLDSIFTKASAAYGVDKNLLLAIGYHESRFQSGATSSKGAMGIMQLMPSAAADMGVMNAYDPEQNIMGAAKLLDRFLDKYNGDTSMALAAYAMGPSALANAISETGSMPESVRKIVDDVISLSREGGSLLARAKDEYPDPNDILSGNLKNEFEKFAGRSSYPIFMSEFQRIMKSRQAYGMSSYDMSGVGKKELLDGVNSALKATITRLQTESTAASSSSSADTARDTASQTASASSAETASTSDTVSASASSADPSGGQSVMQIIDKDGSITQVTMSGSSSSSSGSSGSSSASTGSSSDSGETSVSEKGNVVGLINKDAATGKLNSKGSSATGSPASSGTSIGTAASAGASSGASTDNTTPSADDAAQTVVPSDNTSGSSSDNTTPSADDVTQTVVPSGDASASDSAADSPSSTDTSAEAASASGNGSTGTEAPTDAASTDTSAWTLPTSESASTETEASTDTVSTSDAASQNTAGTTGVSASEDT
ncbi:MAG: transglycosylase SLT domain-containing protein [Lachnospiraceae bacterium]|nr:transglycosylase SLT domain-containing protein [Lachnospiraceae bacterium]